MSNLAIQYMGLDLENPFVVSSSSLTNTVDKVEKCAAAGAGAVVLKSLFEEEIQASIDSMGQSALEHTEALDYITSIETSTGLQQYIDLIRGAKKAVSIPVIASVNAVREQWWVEHVPKLESAGADAIELNISRLPSDYRDSDEKIINSYVKTVEQVRKIVSVPIAVKIGHYFTSIPAFVDKLGWAGADAVVLFNRFYQIDIDITKMKLSNSSPLSSPEDLAVPLRWLTLLYGNTDLDMAASSGVHDGNGAVKAVLAGATAVQVCSALYKHGVDYLTTIKQEFAGWMETHRFDSVAEMRGRLSQKQSNVPESYERLQYIKALVGQE
ncbi:MAG: dihydroorotate dehydrogenase-like protein [Alkalispirochaetaceae bacterium]